MSPSPATRVMQAYDELNDRALQQIEDLSDEFITCRTLGHAWDDNPTATVDSDLWRSSVGVMSLLCWRCHTERFDYIGNDMKVAKRYYRYPPRYRTIPGQGSRPNLRGECLKRSLLIRTYQPTDGRRKR